MANGHPHTADSKARITRGLHRFHERRRAAQRVVPADLRALETPGAPIRAELRPYAQAAALEVEAIIAAKGGPDQVTAIEQLLAEDAGRLGLPLRGLVLAYGQTGDPELASRIATVANARRAIFGLLGLEERRTEVDLHEYLAQRSSAQGPAAPLSHADRDADPDRGVIVAPGPTGEVEGA